MATKLEMEEYLYRRAIQTIESPDTDQEIEDFSTRKSGLPWRIYTKNYRP